MKKQYRTGQLIHRLSPCPSYDIAGMENWLSDMAEKGFFLKHDGFFAGIATFEYKGPQKVKYRLEAAQKSTSMWSDSGGEPDPEQVELSEKFSWEYVAKRNDFFIYRSLDSSARELNTDPNVQALALNAVKKRKKDAVLGSFLLLVVNPILMTRGCPVMTIMSIGTWWTILALLFTVLMIADEVKAFIHLRKVQKSLINEGLYSFESYRQKSAVPYYTRKVIKTVLVIVLVFAFLRTWGISITGENKIPIDEYTKELPFATMKDFAGEGSSEYALNMSTLGMNFNTLEEKTDLLVPRVIDYNEHATVKKADENYIKGGLYVNYCELYNSTLAKQLAKEFYRFDKKKKIFDPIDTPELTADYAVAYLDDLHFPTIIIQKENIVVKAYFYQTSEFYQMPIEEWAKIISDSLKKLNE